MRFLSIEFKNYRCFPNGRLEFPDGSNGKNINLIIAPNGGGKTELLFAFWWVLERDFGDRFEKMSAKGNTPYSLNSDMYRQLDASPEGTRKSASVILEFENEGVTYRLRKDEEFHKTNMKITSFVHYELSNYDTWGALGLPQRQEKAEGNLSRILPSSLLRGIIFDGEQMQQLAGETNQSKVAIKGVIRNITNVQLLEDCKAIFDSNLRRIAKELRSLKGGSAFKNLSEIMEQIDACKERIKTLEEKKAADNKSLQDVLDRLAELSKELSKLEKVEKLEDEQKKVQESVAEAEAALSQAYRDFASKLQSGYLIEMKPKLEKIKKETDTFGMFQGITAQTVEQILSKNLCICGRELTDDARKLLSELHESLPKNNQKSILHEEAIELISDAGHISEDLYDYYQNVCMAKRAYLKQEKNALKSVNARLADCLAQYESEGRDIKSLTEERDTLLERKGALEDSIPLTEENLEDAKKELNTLTITRGHFAKANVDAMAQETKIRFLEKGKRALDAYAQINRQSALSAINEKIDTAHKQISEDGNRGLRIIQYNPTREYEMVAYSETAYCEAREKINVSAQTPNSELSNKTDDELKELAILKSLEGSSTGQSKINALSFVKAILDYAVAPKKDDTVAVQKEYPLVIDAPFSNIAGDNLLNTAKHLHEFAKQLVLMLDPDRYARLKDLLGDYIGTVYVLKKDETHSCSEIEKVEE